MTETAEKLLPCPFCGGRADFMVARHNFNDVFVECSKCSTQGPLFDEEKGPTTEHEAINRKNAAAHWNRRVIKVKTKDLPRRRPRVIL